MSTGCFFLLRPLTIQPDIRQNRLAGYPVAGYPANFISGPSLEIIIALQVLHLWFESLCSAESTIPKFYSPHALISSPGKKKHSSVSGYFGRIQILIFKKLRIRSWVANHIQTPDLKSINSVV